MTSPGFVRTRNSNRKVYEATQGAPDQAQTATANGRVMERMVAQHDCIQQEGFPTDLNKGQRAQSNVLLTVLIYSMIVHNRISLKHAQIEKWVNN